MSMQLSDLVADLKNTLQDTTTKFDANADADFHRHLKRAAIRLARKRPRTLIGSVELTADLDTYTAPADFVGFKAGLWGKDEQRKYKPWDKRHPGRLPTVSVAEQSDQTVILLSPSPSAELINCLGSSYKFFYYAAHTLSETVGKTTVGENDRDLLLLAATIEAMGELANSGTTNPIQLHRGMGSQAKATTAAGWFETLNELYEAAP